MVQTINVKSIKTPECRGNVQITVGRFVKNGSPETVADIDFDEDFAFAAHASDVVNHYLLGTGTNPMLIYEYIKARDPRANLGYALEPKGTQNQLRGR